MKAKQRAKIKAYVQEHRQELEAWWIEMVSKLVKEPTVNVVRSRLAKFPYLKVPGEETRVATLVKQWADGLGLKHEAYARIPERENLLVHFGRGISGKRLLIPTHSDVVPPGDGWESDPFKVEVDAAADRVYGRGVSDNKGAMAATLLAVKILKDCGVELDGDLTLGIVADEEVHSEEGVDYGLGFLMELGALKADWTIVPDIGGNMKTLEVAEKGRVVYIVKAYGRQAHASTPHLGLNAINSMAEFLVRLKGHLFRHQQHELLGSYTVNVGEISGGAAANIVPGYCQASIDMRLVPGMTMAGVRQELETLAEGLDGRFEVVIQSGTEAHEVDYRHSPLVNLVRRIGGEVGGEEPRLIGMGGNTYAKHLFFHGIKEAIGFSAGDNDAMHVANEYASISEHVRLAQAFAEISVELL